MVKHKKIILSIISVIIILLVSTVSIFAELPVYPSSSAVTYLPQMLTRDDIELLGNGMRAQLQLLIPTITKPTLFFITMVKDSDSLYYYRAYTEATDASGDYNGTLSFRSASNIPDEYEYGMYICSTKTYNLIYRTIYPSITGGIMGKSNNAGLFYKGDVGTFGYKLADNEVVVAVWDNSRNTCLGTAPAQFYSTAYTPANLAQMNSVKSMAQSWIEARDVKANGLPNVDNSYNQGYTDGYNAGVAEAQTEAYNNGYNAGYNTGKNEAQTAAYNEGYQAGDTAGYERGHNVGYQEGDSAGYQRGYNSGYTQGFTDGQTAAGSGDSIELDVPSVITSVPIAVKQFIITAFGFEVFGINIAGLISIFIIIGLSLIVLRYMKG